MPQVILRAPAGRDELRGRRDVPGRGQVVYRVVSGALGLEPRGGPAVERGHETGLGSLQLAAQQLPEQVVVSVPVTRGVEGYQEQVVALDPFESRRGHLALQQGVAQRAAQPAQYGGPEQEGAQIRRLAIEHLSAQVVHDVAVVAGERPDERGRVGAALQRQGGEVEPGGPALGPPVEQRHVLLRQVQPQDLVEQERGLADDEAQIVRPDLQEVACRPEPRQRHRRIRSGRQHQAKGRRHPVDDERQLLVDRRVRHEMVVVQDEHDLVLKAGQLVEQRGQDDLTGVGARPEELDGASGNPGVRLLQRGDHVVPEAGEVIVGRVQGEPGEPVTVLLLGDPLGEDGRLPPSGGRVEQRELVGLCGGEGFYQRWTADALVPEGGDVQLGGHEGAPLWRARLARHGATIGLLPSRGGDRPPGSSHRDCPPVTGSPRPRNRCRSDHAE